MLQRTQKRILCGALSALFLLLGAPESVATPISSGDISLEFKNPPTPTAPWELSINASAIVPFEDGHLSLQLIGATGGTIEEVLLWEGRVTLGDSISLDHSFPPPSPGRYSLAASLGPFPHGESGRGGASEVAYVLVTSDTVFVAWGSNWENLRNEILYDARKRGLGDASPEELKTLAPDLAECWDNLHHPKGITTIRSAPQPKRDLDSLPPPIEGSDSVGIEPVPDESTLPDSGSQRMQFWDPDSMWPGWSAKQREFHEKRRNSTKPRRRATAERTPGDSEYGRSEEGKRRREESQRFLDTTSIRYDTTSLQPDTSGD